MGGPFLLTTTLWERCIYLWVSGRLTVQLPVQTMVQTRVCTQRTVRCHLPSTNESHRLGFREAPRMLKGAPCAFPDQGAGIARHSATQSRWPHSPCAPFQARPVDQTANQSGHATHPRLLFDQSLQPMAETYRGMRPSSDTVPPRLQMAKIPFVAPPETNTPAGSDYLLGAASIMAEVCPNAGRIRTFV